MARRPDSLGPEMRAPRPERQAAFRLGLSAESRAAAFLIAKGYRIVARRRRKQVLVFVEVKARDRLDDAAESVTERQQRRIAAAAAAWLAEHPDDVNSDIRFDAVLVAPRRLPRHILAAFESEF